MYCGALPFVLPHALVASTVLVCMVFNSVVRHVLQYVCGCVLCGTCVLQVGPLCAVEAAMAAPLNALRQTTARVHVDTD